MVLKKLMDKKIELIVFINGAVLMGLEITGARLFTFESSLFSSNPQ